MNTFQTIVVPFALALAVTELIRWLRGGRRIGVLKAIIWVCFAGAVYEPDLVQRLAGMTNIGRGADLLLYGLTVFVLLTTFYFLNQLEINRRQMTLLVRQLAVSKPRFPDAHDTDAAFSNR
jgi:hypothetical protein